MSSPPKTVPVRTKSAITRNSLNRLLADGILVGEIQCGSALALRCGVSEGSASLLRAGGQRKLPDLRVISSLAPGERLFAICSQILLSGQRALLRCKWQPSLREAALVGLPACSPGVLHPPIHHFKDPCHLESLVGMVVLGMRVPCCHSLGRITQPEQRQVSVRSPR